VQSILEAPAHPVHAALLACHPERATSFVGIPGLVPSPLARPTGCLFAPRCGDVRRSAAGAAGAGRGASGAVVRCVQYA
jgi:oligopeptide/dipeptide ABC transporter ATP-binding protein